MPILKKNNKYQYTNKNYDCKGFVNCTEKYLNKDIYIYKKYCHRGYVLSEVAYLKQKKNGIERRYSFFFNRKRIEWEYLYINGELQGIAIGFSKNLYLLQEIPFKDNKKNGIFRAYYNNGLIGSSDAFVNEKELNQSEVCNYDGTPFWKKKSKIELVQNTHYTGRLL